MINFDRRTNLVSCGVISGAKSQLTTDIGSTIPVRISLSTTRVCSCVYVCGEGGGGGENNSISDWPIGVVEVGANSDSLQEDNYIDCRKKSCYNFFVHKPGDCRHKIQQHS